MASMCNVYRLAWFILAVSSATAQVTKPVMSPAIPFSGRLNTVLRDNLKMTPYTMDQWGWGWLPLRCKVLSEQYGLNPYDVNVYNVHFNDCDQAWVVCRHHNAEMSLKDMVENLGRLPVQMRNFVRHQFAMPQHSPTIGGATFSDLGDTLWEGPVGGYFYAWAHEVGHTIDRNTGPPNGDYSSTQEWLTEYNKDRAVADSYSQTNHAENFAQEVVVALFDVNVSGGIGVIAPNWSDIYNQYTAVRNKLGNILRPGGRCQRRFKDDAIVCMGPAAGCQNNAKAKAPETQTQDAWLAKASAKPPIQDTFPAKEEQGEKA